MATFNIIQLWSDLAFIVSSMTMNFETNRKYRVCVKTNGIVERRIRERKLRIQAVL